MTNEGVEESYLLEIESFTLRLPSLELQRDGEPVELPAQPARLLRLLAERAGETVTRQELQRRLWADTPHGVDGAINACVRQVRRALGDCAHAPRFIETLPRRGYRFVATVRRSSPEAPVGVLQEPTRGARASVGDRRPALSRPPRLRSQRWLAAAATGALVALAGASGVLVLGGEVASETSRETSRMVSPRRAVATPPLPPSAALELARARFLIEQGGAGPAEALRVLEGLEARSPGRAEIGATIVEAELFSGQREAALGRARSLVARAPDSADAHRALGAALMMLGRELDTAERHLRRALQLEEPDERTLVALAYLLAATGRPAEAMARVEQALELDAVSALIRADAGLVAYLAGDFDRAAEMCALAVEMRPDAYWAEDCAQHALVQAGDLERAADRILPALVRWGRPAAVSEPWLAAPEPEARLRGFWRWRARRLEARGVGGHWQLAGLYADLGERERALDALERAAEEVPASWISLGVEPRFAALRDSPRFQRLLQRGV